MQFSETFRVRSHQTQRSGPISGSTPSIGDVHEAKKFNAKIQEALDYVLQKVRTEEAERVAERAAREAMEKRQVRPERSDEPINGRKEISDGSLNNSDTKKRRGVSHAHITLTSQLTDSFPPSACRSTRTLSFVQPCGNTGMASGPRWRSYALQCLRTAYVSQAKPPLPPGDLTRSLADYAKHARKYGAQKAAVAGSNLRPKSAGRHS